MKKTFYLVAVLALIAAAFTIGCRKPGAGAKVGESLDKAGDKIHDVVTPDGPAEKLGKKVDKTVEDIKDDVRK